MFFNFCFGLPGKGFKKNNKREKTEEGKQRERIQNTVQSMKRKQNKIKRGRQSKRGKKHWDFLFLVS